MALNYNEMDLASGDSSITILQQYGIRGKKVKMIIFDRLVPLDPQLENQYQYYVPDAERCNGLVFSGDGWIFLKNIDARNNPALSKKRK